MLFTKAAAFLFVAGAAPAHANLSPGLSPKTEEPSAAPSPSPSFSNAPSPAPSFSSAPSDEPTCDPDTCHDFGAAQATCLPGNLVGVGNALGNSQDTFTNAGISLMNGDPMFVQSPSGGTCWSGSFDSFPDDFGIHVLFTPGSIDGAGCTSISFVGGRLCTGSCQDICLSRRLRSRNLFEDATALEEQDAVYQDYSAKCANYDFDVALYVDTHMMAVASPKQDAVAAGCPFLVTHSTYDVKTHKHNKELLAWSGEMALQDANNHFNSDSYFIGTFKGSDLAKAHESIDINKVTQGGKSYDVVSNNCAGFMIALAKSLNVKIDAKMTAFVARRLLQSSTEEFVDRIRSSVNFKSLFGGLRQLRSESSSDKEIIELLVENTSAGLV